MKTHTHMSVGLLLVVAPLLFAQGCWSSAPSRIMPAPIASDAASKAMELYDANKDGQLDATELKKAPGLEAALPNVDKNNDGKISADEINARITDWKDSKVGRMPITVTILHNGKPLGGATVSLVPESFLGTDLTTGTGTTSDSGTASIEQPKRGDDDFPGMSPGFYRVQVTKAGETIPATYNTDTTLGVEAAQDAANLRTGIKFDLKY